MKPAFTPADVSHIAKLANIPITEAEEKSLADGFNTTMNVVEKLAGVNVKDTEPLHQVTGLADVFRDDTVDESRMLSQDAALANAPRVHQGYFVVDQILDQE